MSLLTPVKSTGRPAPLPRLSKPYVPGRRSSRFWTEAEKDVLRQHYETRGAAACALKLPGRHIGKIYQMARQLGLTAPHAPRRSRQDISVHDEAIKAAWPALEGKGAVTALAIELGIERWKVSKRATALGLTMPHKKEPPWTAAEVALMGEVPLHDPDRAARIFREHGFRRTAAAIAVKAKRLELSRRRRDVFSAGRAAALLGVDAKMVTGWCIAGELKATRQGTKRLPQQGGDSWAIQPADLRRFIIDHIERIDLRKVEKFGFVALVAGDETGPASATEGEAR